MAHSTRRFNTLTAAEKGILLNKILHLCFAAEQGLVPLPEVADVLRRIHPITKSEQDKLAYLKVSKKGGDTFALLKGCLVRYMNRNKIGMPILTEMDLGQALLEVQDALGLFDGEFVPV